MKTQEEMMAYFRSMPKKEKKNPYWEFDPEEEVVRTRSYRQKVTLQDSKALLTTVRKYFRWIYRSYGTEAQVLCVTEEDGQKLAEQDFPVLKEKDLSLMGIPVTVIVLPQKNTPINSILSESLWQEAIVGNQIIPVARIHSHHVLDAYQSATDYSTLNSNTLEIVMGEIGIERFQIAYWLDEHGKDTKSFVYRQREQEYGNFETVRIKSGKPSDRSCH